MLEFEGIEIEAYRGLDQSVAPVIMVVRRACALYICVSKTHCFCSSTRACLLVAGTSLTSILNPNP